MTEYALDYDATTGAQTGSGYGPDGTVANQPLPEGRARMLVSLAVYNSGFPADLALIKADKCAAIEASADAIAATIITLSPRKVQTAMAIKEESDRWITGSSPTNFPFLAVLATANGTTIDQEKGFFDAAWAAAVPPGAKINAASIAAQRKINAAANLAEIATAASVDWNAVLAA